ncbi:MAG: glucokinase [Chloroflexi bacterium]|nr:glucokinase [Chloroflexota bacterium]
MLLAGDIGGTKTILALYSEQAGVHRPVRERRFASAQYPSLNKIVQLFLQDVDVPVDRASFGVAGPVVEGRAQITNLAWEIDARTLQETLAGAEVHLLNDLQAIASAVPILKPDDLFQLNAGDTVPGGAIAVVAPGTGLGEAYLTWEDGYYHAHASEGGHTEFAPRNQAQMDLLRYLLQRMPHVSYERVISGIGLPNIYMHLRHLEIYEEPAWLQQQLAAADDLTPVIIRGALQTPTPNEICLATVEMFISILAAEAGNLALKVLATGGVFIGGGIPPRILSLITASKFMQNFASKGRLSDLLLQMPVHVILSPHAALVGAAHYGMECGRRASTSS